MLRTGFKMTRSSKPLARGDRTVSKLQASEDRSRIKDRNEIVRRAFAEKMKERKDASRA